MRRQHVPNLGCQDTETVWTEMHSLSAWHNHVLVVSECRWQGKASEVRACKHHRNLLEISQAWSCISSVLHCIKIQAASVDHHGMLALYDPSAGQQ